MKKQTMCQLDQAVIIEGKLRKIIKLLRRNFDYFDDGTHSETLDEVYDYDVLQARELLQSATKQMNILATTKARNQR